MDARCPECEKVAVLDDEITKVKCPHCSFEADYETYLEIMKEKALNMRWETEELFLRMFLAYVGCLFSNNHFL